MAAGKWPLNTPDARPELIYAGIGRSGTIHYVSIETSFDVWYEMAAEAFLNIAIPEPRYWEAQTKTPLSRRNDILRFISEQVIQDKLNGNGYSLANDNMMTIYCGRKPDSD